MEKIWLKNYPQGVPAEIDVFQYESLMDIFEQSCAAKEYQNKPAFSCFGTSITYKELDILTRHFAAYLQKDLGIQRGERLAIMLPNLVQYPVALFGAFRAGLVVVNINPLYTAPELVHILNDSGARAIIVLENFAHVLQQALPETELKTVFVTKIGDLLPIPKRIIFNFVAKYIKKMIPAWYIPNAICFNRALKIGAKLAFDRIPVAGAETAFLQYTGGTTGVAKGAILTHRNMVANVLQLRAWVKPMLTGGEEIIITALPLYHIFSLTVNCLTYLSINAQNVLITNPRDINGFINELRKIKFTAMTGVNTLFNALLNHKDFSKINFSNLRFCISGGMALQRSVAERWQRLAKCPLVEGYGLTEASPVVTANPLDITAYTGSIGYPLPSTDISIRDEQNNEVPLGEEGEICVLGPQVMQGYWHGPEQTQQSFTEDGWLRTGDIGKVDEQGLFYLVDRKKDLIIVSGFNVYPNEIEDVIAKHPGVQEVAVVGVADEHAGEVVKAFVVKKDPNLTEEEIIEFCHQSLTRYKVPKHVEFRQDLPKTNVGKILRRALKE